MQVLRGRLHGSGVELLEPAQDAAPGTNVLVLVLSGELERAAGHLPPPSPPAAVGETPFEAAVARGQRPATAGEIMTTRLITVNPRMAVIRAMHLMTQEGVTSVLVEPGAAGDWGIMTMRDVLDRIVRTNRSADLVAVGELATRPLATVPPDTSLQACSELMLRRSIRRLVVEQGGRPTGIVSETDIFRVVEQFGWGD